MGTAIGPTEHVGQLGRKQEISDLLQRAGEGDRSVLPALRQRFEEYPVLWEECGDLAVQAERSQVRLMTGANEIAAEALDRKLASLRKEIAGANPTPLDRLLIQRVVACWLQVQHADVTYTQAMQDGVNLAHGDYYQRRQDRAQRRYLSAIRTLAQVRRLLTPQVQLNVASQQVNVTQIQTS